ncbi:MAG: hypothetical protein AAB817_01755 [Patescibacteria group bacterium]
MAKQKSKQAWVVAVNMGYGHQRAAHPFHDMAKGGIITANDYPGIPKNDRVIWERSRAFYETVSRAKHIPLFGEALFEWYDRTFQAITPLYPKHSEAAADWQLKQTYKLIREGWGKDLIDRLAKDGQRPLLTTFFIVAFFAEEHGYPGDIYCLATDTDISRQWAPLEPPKTRIRYFAPTPRAAERLALYGVPKKNIILTGVSLPPENIGGLGMPTLKADLWKRLHHLDPRHYFIGKYQDTLRRHLGPEKEPGNGRPLTITFAVGGAGAQQEIGGEIAWSLRRRLRRGECVLNLVAGTKPSITRYFTRKMRLLRLGSRLGKNIHIITAPTKDEYFQQFNRALRTTDILWTKPSELVFYTGLGLPIIMAPPIGSQEDFNRRWLFSIGGGTDQLDPRYTDQWLFDWLASGWLAEAAWQGFIDAPKLGTYEMKRVIFHKHRRHEQSVTAL